MAAMTNAIKPMTCVELLDGSFGFGVVVGCDVGVVVEAVAVGVGPALITESVGTVAGALEFEGGGGDCGEGGGGGGDEPLEEDPRAPSDTVGVHDSANSPDCKFMAARDPVA